VGITLQIARRLPPALLVRLGRLRYSSRILRPLLEWAYRPLQHGEATISRGVGKGLRFDPAGGNPGYAIGSIAMPEQELLRRHLKTAATFYHIGANVGFFAMIGAKLVGPTGRVYAFEPYHQSAVAIRANAARNGFTNVSVLETAVGHSKGTGIFQVTGTVGEFRLIADEPSKTAGTTEVPVISIDDLVATREIAPPDFVMIDFEGAEIAVLEGMRLTITWHHPLVVCEVHGCEAAFADKCAEIFGPIGYRVSRLQGGRIVDESDGRFHALMMPPDAS
jgi:FkbM family methyltransferase